MQAKTVLVIHGGAGSGRQSNQRKRAIKISLGKILHEIYPLLQKNMSALEAVARAVQLLEDDELFNAGKGSKIQSDGHVRMSASIMDGHTRTFAGCVNVERVKNPILLAKALLRNEDRVLAGQGAQSFARQIGLAFASPFTSRRLAEFQARRRGKSGTVGAVALDSKGRLAAATSTGGKGNEVPHRVSDSPTSAGNFANRYSAVSATGTGEEIVEFAVASALCTLTENGISLKQATADLIRRAKRARAQFGFISLDNTGTIVTAKTTLGLSCGGADKFGVWIRT